MSFSRARRVCIVVGLVWMSIGSRTAFGQLLVSDRATNKILQFNLDGSSPQTLVDPDDLPKDSNSESLLNGPASMAFDNGNDLFVACQNNGMVLRFDGQTGEFRDVFASGIYGPGGLLFDAGSNVLFVSEFGNFDGELIHRFNATTGASLGTIGVGTGATGRAGMAMDDDGRLYVSSFYGGSVLRFDDPAGISPAATTFASGPMSFLGTNAIVFDPAGNLDAIGLMTHDVYQFSSNGDQIGDLIAEASGQLTYPCAMLVAPDGNLLVSSLGNNNLSDPSKPQGPGYIGEYDVSTGAVVNQFFIHDIDPFQPTAMLIMPAPEPSTLALAMVGGLTCLAWAARRRLVVRQVQTPD
jgi:DNA-binding beta-propeller fold protein YncE